MTKHNNEIASKRIPVTDAVWRTLHGLRKPGQTYNELLTEMIPDFEARRAVEYGEIIYCDPVNPHPCRYNHGEKCDRHGGYIVTECIFKPDNAQRCPEFGKRDNEDE